MNGQLALFKIVYNTLITEAGFSIVIYIPHFCFNLCYLHGIWRQKQQRELQQKNSSCHEPYILSHLILKNVINAKAFFIHNEWHWDLRWWHNSALVRRERNKIQTKICLIAKPVALVPPLSFSSPQVLQVLHRSLVLLAFFSYLLLTTQSLSSHFATFF